jgi:hypothetical protein
MISTVQGDSAVKEFSIFEYALDFPASHATISDMASPLVRNLMSMRAIYRTTTACVEYACLMIENAVLSARIARDASMQVSKSFSFSR